MRAQCDTCGSFGSAYVPKGGDGWLWFMRPHNCNGFSRAKRRVANVRASAPEAGDKA